MGDFIRTLLNTFAAWFNRKPGHVADAPVLQETVEMPGLTLKIYRDLLTLNKYSRPGRKRKGILAVEVHWVANPMTSAKANRAWFEGRKGGKHSFGSTQYIVDLDGDVVLMIPEDEIAYSSGAKRYRDGIIAKYGNPPYYNTLSIECTHRDWKGKMTQETYNSLVNLCAYLLKKHGLTARNLELHFDITGKLCHRWFVDNPNEWGNFRDKVDELIGKFESITKDEVISTEY